jgi:hypothetical protein
VDGAAVIGPSNEERLVVADGLMDRGDPRGEFIALQLRIARATASTGPRPRR